MFNRLKPEALGFNEFGVWSSRNFRCSVHAFKLGSPIAPKSGYPFPHYLALILEPERNKGKKDTTGEPRKYPQSPFQFVFWLYQLNT